MSLLTNIVSYYKLDSNSNDSVGSNNGSDTAISYANAGKIGNCATFNGSSSKAVIADATSLKPTGNFSISGWVKTTFSGGLGDNLIFQSWSQNPTYNAGIQLRMNDTNIGDFSLTSGNDAGGFGYINTIAGGFNDGAWHFVVATYDGTKLYLYVDGSLNASTAYTTNPAYAATNYIQIGARNMAGTSDRFFTGSIDELGIWSRALSADEVSQLYNSGAGLQYPFSSTNGNFLAFF